MGHFLEIVDGRAQMAWAGEEPWHGLGVKVPADLTPEQIMKAAGLDWSVSIQPGFSFPNGAPHRSKTWDKMTKDEVVSLAKAWEKGAVQMRHGVLVRSSDQRVLTEVPFSAEDDESRPWHPIQNAEAFEFFNDFIGAGDMEMHTAGSLHNGEIVWALAKIKDSFDAVVGKKGGGKDTVESYLLLTNPHRYGVSSTALFTPIRVVCWNTFSMALSRTGTADRRITISHRKKFNGDEVKEALGIAKEKLAKYKEAARFLSTKRYSSENVVDYFKRLFPVSGLSEEKRVELAKKKSTRAKKEISKQATTSLALLDTQPGADFAPGTWWNAFNAATFYTDHVHGRTDDSRMESAWFGWSRKKKVEALELATELANAA